MQGGAHARPTHWPIHWPIQQQQLPWAMDLLRILSRRELVSCRSLAGVLKLLHALLPPLCSRGSHSVRMPSMDFGAWGGSTEEAVRARYAETAQIRAQQPRSKHIAWIVRRRSSQCPVLSRRFRRLCAPAALL
jgi:hypothetical protein